MEVVAVLEEMVVVEFIQGVGFMEGVELLDQGKTKGEELKN